MALEDILGETQTIKIFDFLAENPEDNYTVLEISENLKIPKSVVKTKLMEMQVNGLIEFNEKAQDYGLKNNQLVQYLIKATIMNSFICEE